MKSLGLSWVRWARTGLLAAAIALAALFALGLKTVLAGEAARRDAERAFDRGELRESVRQARRAATLFIPFAPHVTAGYRRLIVVARGAEEHGQPHVAAFAWSSLRAAALESAAPGFRHEAERELADRNLARLANRVATGGSAPDSAGEAALLRTLEARDPQRADGFAISALGLVLAAAGLAWVALRGLAADGRVLRVHVATGSLLVLIGVACWTLALLRA